MKLLKIHNEKRFYVKNVIHFSVGCVQGTYADSARVEALKCEVKDEPNVGEGNISYLFVCSLHPTQT